MLKRQDTSPVRELKRRESARQALLPAVPLAAPRHVTTSRIHATHLRFILPAACIIVSSDDFG
jgi:hypothetical protein